MNGQHEPGTDAFREEANELLMELERDLKVWSGQLADREIVNRIFRAVHTIKGSSAMFGYDAIAAFTHGVESTLDRVRSGALPATQELIDLTLRARDHIAALLENPGHADSGAASGEQLQTAFVRLTADAASPVIPETPPPQIAPAAPDGPLATYRIRFKPKPNILATGTDPLLLMRELCGLGEAEVTMDASALPALDAIDPEASYLGWTVQLVTRHGINAIRDVFIFVEGDSEIQIEEIPAAPPPMTDVQPSVAESAATAIPPEPSERDSASSTPRAAPAPEVAKPRSTPQAQAQVQPARISVRVPAERLDTLGNLVGELVTVQARLSQLANHGGDPDLLSVSEAVDAITAELRDIALSLRMVPVGALFARFGRLVRDLSQELGREVDLVLSGEQTELDKTVIERLNDPLVHLIRNSLDHGIEPPAVRRERGKPARGRLEITAEHVGTSVLIRLQDDGAGINPVKVRDKAIERGLIQPGATLSTQEVLGLIFSPGFSTASKVSNISGRGVGLDVVKRSIEALRGTISVNSEPGQGTEIIIRLPLTLAIIEGLLVATGDHRFIVPLTVVEECVALTPELRAEARGRSTITVREEMVPYVSLREQFLMEGDRPRAEQIVIGSVHGQRFGLVVDRVLGNHQAVIKHLGKMFNRIHDVSGATILGDGSVALVLDIVNIANTAEQRNRDGDLRWADRPAASLTVS